MLFCADGVLQTWEPGHFTLSTSKSYIQPKTAELLVKEQITVLHVAVIVIPVICLVLLS